MNAPSNAPSICGEQGEVAMHVRTDERTNGDVSSPTADISRSVTRTRTYEMGEVDWSDCILEAIDALEIATSRLGAPRPEQRNEIHRWTRRAIYWRDRNQCAWCQRGFDAAGMLVLDHITPWAAGGSDRSDNLRTLCVPCNDERSNYATDAYARVLSVGLCDHCYANPRPRAGQYLTAGELDPQSPFRQVIFCGRCGRTGACTDRRRVL